MPPTKHQLDKATWQWCDTTQPDAITEDNLITAYRLNLKPCSRSTCRRNCKGNPHCLIGIGEKEWLCDITDENLHDVEDPESERRGKNPFVGLKNLGATCYVNTLLQVWFCNETFRSAIYRLVDKQWENKTDTVGYKPSNVGGHLQLLFSLLQFSKRRYIDPSPFVQCLGLSTDQQQDAQEFSKLLMSLLEEVLSDQTDLAVKNIIQQQFAGQYVYVTRCNSCQNVSQKPSTFYELDLSIKGHKELHECIKIFLKEEKLDGDNQYMCMNCNSKQNAVRHIQLTKPPPVLNVQLLRFVFDRQTGHKKKLNTYIEFPEDLDISQYLDAEPDTYIYELYGVLIHSGPSAYSGHYVAHIKDRKSNTWYKFNDEVIVEEMKGKKLNLGNEEEITDTSNSKTSTKVPKVSKGHHTSKNAYMLVYQQKTANQDGEASLTTHDILPEYVRQHIDMDNETLEQWISEMKNMKEQNIRTGQEKRGEMRQFYEELPVQDGEDFDWIPTDWLNTWLSVSKEIKPPIDNKTFLCQHKKLHPDKVCKLKCVHRQTADKLYDMYKGGPRLHRDAVCLMCVKKRCTILRTRVNMDQDSKLISDCLKNQYNGDNGYWVGKKSLRSWKSLVIKQCEDTENGEDNVEEKTETKKESDNEDENLSFNDDILCSHDKLSTDAGCRRLISTDIWQRLRSYFPLAVEFKQWDPVCELCNRLEEEEEQVKEIQKMVANEQKTQLSDLYQERNRPKAVNGVVTAYVVQKDWITEWRNYIKNPVAKEHPAILSNENLLCAHGNCTIDPKTLPFSDSLVNHTGFVLIWPSEWLILKQAFSTHAPFEVHRVEAQGQPVVYFSNPAVCEECAQAMQLDKDNQQWSYKNVKIYIRKVLDDNATDDTDSDYQQVHVNGKRKKKMNCNQQATTVTKMIKSTNVTTRRSARHRKTKGEKEIIISSDETLRDLKLQIMHMFSVAPFDQHLSVNGQDLTGDHQTLGSLHIAAEDIIYFRADEPCDDPLLLEEVSQSLSPEEGFKGTGLMGGVNCM